MTLRPSSIGSYINCQWQWYNVFILGKHTIPSARATLGTAVHKSAEVVWEDAIKTGKKDLNISQATDAAIEEYHECLKKDEPQFDVGDTKESLEKLVIEGTKSWIEDIAPSVDIPVAVEKRYTIEINNPIFERISGSLDYVGEKSIHDIKTTKRKPTLSNYSLQQGTYALLREGNGETVDEVKIQAVVFNKKDTKALILDMVEDNTNPFIGLDAIKNQSRFIVNNILEKTKVYSKDIVKPELLFTGNPKSNLCSNKYCSLYNECPFVKGAI